MLVARALSAAPPGAPPVVRDFDLELGPGRWIAITGPNGTGKSTLLLTLAGLWPAAAGTVELAGVTIGPQAAAARSRNAVLLQDPAGQLLQATVADEMAMAARNLGHPEAEVAAAVAEWSGRLGLTGHLDSDPRTLSAGRQQLVLLAAAFVARPAFLFSDEGGAHLDGPARRLALEVLRGEVTKGLSVVWVTQEEEECAAADRVMELGEIRSAAADLDRPEPHRPGGPIPGAGGNRDPAGDPVVPARLTIQPWDGTPGRAVRVPERVDHAFGGRGVTAIEGRNGTGKSVLLEAIAGVSELPQVRIEWAGRFRHPPILAAQYPEHQIFAERVGEEVLFAVRTRGGDEAEARIAAGAHFEVLGLGGAAFLERRTWSLSAAEKRLVQVVAALIAPADLALLDEPTCGLDPFRRRRLGTLVAARAERGPVVVAGQDLGWHRVIAGARLELGKREASVSVKTD